jgi:hypothetical protein
LASWEPVKGIVVDVLPNLNCGMTEWEMYPERFEQEPKRRMAREITAPFKPKKDDHIAFQGPDDKILHGVVKKVLKGSTIIHVEAAGGKWYEVDIDEDGVTKDLDENNTL